MKFLTLAPAGRGGVRGDIGQNKQQMQFETQVYPHPCLLPSREKEKRPIAWISSPELVGTDALAGHPYLATKVGPKYHTDRLNCGVSNC